jgi:hypothetical protein
MSLSMNNDMNPQLLQLGLFHAAMTNSRGHSIAQHCVLAGALMSWGCLSRCFWQSPSQHCPA